MKLGGPVVIMEEFSSINTCLDASNLLRSKLGNVETECIKK